MKKDKTPIYNLIILDESGSMSTVRKQTISGCNETLNAIRSAQQQYPETQEHYVSIYAFQSDSQRKSRYLIKNTLICGVKDIGASDYEPWGCTPLNDAVGMTLSDLKATCRMKDDAIANVTIITDGYENSSVEYSERKVRQMITELKELGWNFNFIGANIDVERAASAYNIDNTMEFCQDEQGTREMFEKERRSRMKHYEKMDRVMACYSLEPEGSLSREEKLKLRARMLKEASLGYFDELDEEKNEKNA